MFNLKDDEIKTLILSAIISVLAATATAMFTSNGTPPLQKAKNFFGGFCAGLIVAIFNVENDWNKTVEYLTVAAISAFGNVLWPALSAISLKILKKKTDDNLPSA